jgi:hypothetical protein
VAVPLVTIAELVSTSGSDRLSLQCEKEGDGLDFHSLQWDRRSGADWQLTNAITRTEFQARHPNRRWVADLHSFLPATGQAILQIAEGDRPIGAWSVNYTYSWRRWDLLANEEVALLKVCKSPFEPL